MLNHACAHRAGDVIHCFVDRCLAKCWKAKAFVAVEIESFRFNAVRLQHVRPELVEQCCKKRAFLLLWRFQEMFSLVYHECAWVLDRGRMGHVNMSHSLEKIFVDGYREPWIIKSCLDRK